MHPAADKPGCLAGLDARRPKHQNASLGRLGKTGGRRRTRASPEPGQTARSQTGPPVRPFLLHLRNEPPAFWAYSFAMPASLCCNRLSFLIGARPGTFSFGA